MQQLSLLDPQLVMPAPPGAQLGGVTVPESPPLLEPDDDPPLLDELASAPDDDPLDPEPEDEPEPPLEEPEEEPLLDEPDDAEEPDDDPEDDPLPEPPSIPDEEPLDEPEEDEPECASEPEPLAMPELLEASPWGASVVLWSAPLLPLLDSEPEPVSALVASSPSPRPAPPSTPSNVCSSTPRMDAQPAIASVHATTAASLAAVFLILENL